MATIFILDDKRLALNFNYGAKPMKRYPYLDDCLLIQCNHVLLAVDFCFYLWTNSIYMKYELIINFNCINYCINYGINYSIVCKEVNNS